eukprot:TRINITY_DN21293_c0_g2_i1.p1 TRINITY_DN21293_c0_g2~~TRINITY_DN21293_c0_g2_i1.p1  ORF type:complete len:313 (-),score=78.06 TRINITY_DN21293_c0_g2_i1:216-1154(-)
MDLDHNGKIDLEEFLVYARANPDVFGRLATAALQQRAASGMTVSAERSAVSSHSSPRRVLTQIEKMREESTAISPPGDLPFRAGSQPASPAKSPNLMRAAKPSDQGGEWLDLFSQYDLDGNGQLDVHEITLLIGDLLPHTRNPPSKSWVSSQANSMINRMDADGDGLIDYNEFVAYAKNSHQLGDLLSRRGAEGRSMHQASHIKRNDDRVVPAPEEAHVDPNITQEWDSVFKRFDIDRNQKLDLREIEMMVADMLPQANDLGADNLKWVRQTARKLMVEMDTDGDGSVDYHEFMSYMQKHNISANSMLGSRR